MKRPRGGDLGVSQLERQVSEGAAGRKSAPGLGPHLLRPQLHLQVAAVCTCIPQLACSEARLRIWQVLYIRKGSRHNCNKLVRLPCKRSLKALGLLRQQLCAPPPELQYPWMLKSVQQVTDVPDYGEGISMGSVVATVCSRQHLLAFSSCG